MAAHMLAEPGFAGQTSAEPAPKRLLSDLDLSPVSLRRLLDLAARIKRTPARYAQSLAGRYLSLLFEKPSLRTRLTFELAIKQLGGDAVNYAGPIGEREPVKDVARNLDRWTHGIVARVFSQSTSRGTRGLDARPGDQRAERSVSSLPGAGRRADA